MKEIPILSVPIYEFFLEDNTLIQKILTDIKNIQYENNQGNLISTEMYYNEELFSWFDQCINQVKNIYYKDSITLEIIAAWVNKTSSDMGNHHVHLHPNSIVSGCFYLTSHTSGDIEFLSTCPWTNHFKTYSAMNIEHKLFLDKNSNILKTKILPEIGKLILFPSNLVHQVLPLRPDEEDRYSIAFNTFSSGTFSSKKITTNLQIKVKSLKEFFAEQKNIQ
jgi:uncharacterized protein (TIGR02466 family)